MSEQIVQVTEGAGKKLHTIERTVGANQVQDEVVMLGEPYEASYTVSWDGISIATAASHIFGLMAGSTLPVYLRRIVLYQQGHTTAAAAHLRLLRLTTADTGGTLNTPAPMDTTEAAAGATCRLLGTVGTESTVLYQGIWQLAAAIGVANRPFIWDFRHLNLLKSPRIPAGTANGLALKLQTGGGASNTCAGFIEFVERNY